MSRGGDVELMRRGGNKAQGSGAFACPLGIVICLQIWRWVQDIQIGVCWGGHGKKEAPSGRGLPRSGWGRVRKETLLIGLVLALSGVKHI